MKTLALDLPSFAFVVGTRAALGVGIGLLVSQKIPAARRRAIGAALVALGAATTVPALLKVRRGLRDSTDAAAPAMTRFPRKGDDAF